MSPRIAAVALCAIASLQLGSAQNWQLAIEVFADDAALHYSGSAWNAAAVVSNANYNIHDAYFNGVIDAVRVTMNGVTGTFTVRVEDRGLKTLKELVLSGATDTATPGGLDQSTTSTWNLLRDGHEIYTCGEFGFNHVSPYARARIGYLTDQFRPCQNAGSAEGIGLHSTGAADSLAAGRVQWSTEVDRVSVPATVEVLLSAPACTVPQSEWLVTEFAPILDVAGSGFTTGAADVFRFSVDYHRKYYEEVFGTGAAANLQTVTYAENTPADNTLGPCYDNIHLDIAWGDLVPFCARDDTSDASFVIYTCKFIAEGKEDLDAIRGQGLTRVVHNEIPVQVKFPKQVSASVADLSAFQPPNLLAAVVRQEVNVDVSDLGVVAKTQIYTSVQYPFRLHNPTWDNAVAATTPTGISPGVAPVSISDCGPPYPAGGDAPGQPGDEFACNQVWELDLDVANGAGAGSVCELDGDYFFYWEAICVPTFPSDCPLVQDDQGQIQNKFAIKFTLDSEYFCPQVVDEVDVSATLSVYKDIAHSIPASNFILGQTLYVVADVTSNKATVVGAQLDDLLYARQAGDVDVVVDGVEAAGALTAVAWYDSGATVGAAVVPANQVWFQFLVSNPPFSPPVDGSEDFSLTATLNVQFKDATLLLQAGQQVGAHTTSSVSTGGDDSETAGASALVTSSAIAAVGALLA